MTAPAIERPGFRLAPTTVVLLSLAAVAWAGVVAYARDMGNGPGSMGLGIAEFLVMWALMMAAMMLPAVAPVASLYARTIVTHRAPRLAAFIAGYLIAWAAAGVPIYAVLRGVDELAGDSGSALRITAMVALAAAGLYQLTPLKARCLRHCRSPLAQLLHYGNVKGRLRDFKVALHHAGYCLGCCWALMILFVAFGVMNVWAMVGLAAVVVGEKVLPAGDRLSRVLGITFLALALGVAASPRLSDALVPSMDAQMGSSMMDG